MSEVRLINANALFGGKLSDAVKYGNKTEEQQDYSYSTLMMYEIAYEIDAAPTIAPVRDSEEITHLRADLERVERERDAIQAKLDAAVADLKYTHYCGVCIDKGCVNEGWLLCPAWEWRGTEVKP